ncbi:MAG: carbon-nitrogen family hydrolase [Peptococcaceae bacterium]|jgi:predicted amidohydrolase|nr:carbon-nitrogen family hydrolase [Peptococcaceae bacterium]MDH7525553.1 carbon-nitrogen family hydrolase [Peptococcaceae bacterium]
MRLALLQAGIVFGDPRANLEKMRMMAEKAVENKADVVIAPEMWNSSYAVKEVPNLADRAGFPSAEAMGELARRHGINIVAGSIADMRDGRIYNTSYVFDREGRNVARYDKVHLFRLMREDQYLAAGEQRAVFELDGVKCAVIICYDLRFPELVRALALDGAQVLFVPAQWPMPRIHPWRILIQARAIENQMFVAGVNRVGKEGRYLFFGHSMVVDPSGDVLAEGSEDEELLLADIDLEQVKKVREYMTCYHDRVPGVYKGLDS